MPRCHLIHPLKISLGLGILLLPLGLVAQTAQLTGRVADTSQTPVVGATIKIRNLDTGVRLELASSSDGYYTAALMPRGRYQVGAEQAGFRPVLRLVTLDEGQTARVDLTLEIGDVKESVTITAEAPLLDQDSSAVSAVVSNKQIAQLPLLNRNIIALAPLTPTVRSLGSFGGLPVSSNDGGRMSIGGAPPSVNNSLIDGIAAENLTAGVIDMYLSVDATQEFRVITKTPPAEYGRTGGGVVSVTSKSGTNEYHGNAYEFFRNTLLNANDFFANRVGKERVATNLNQFGGTIGGPIIRQKTFFFANFEGFEYRQAQSIFRTVPTLSQRSGDFNGTLDATGRQVVIYDPLTTRANPAGSGYIRDVISCNGQLNVICSSRISPIAQAILKYYPPPNQPGVGGTGQNNFFGQASVPQNDRLYGLRVDHNFSERQRISARYTYGTALAGFANYFGLAESNATNAPLNRNSAALNYVYSFSPTLLFEGRFGGNSYGQDRKTRSTGFGISSLGLPAALQSQMQVLQFPSISVSDVSSLGAGTGDTILQNSYTATLAAALTKVAGVHTLKMGTDNRIYRLNNTQASVDNLSLAFSRSFTQGPTPNSAATNAGQGVATFLLGYPTSGSAGITATTQMQVRYFGLFVQDDWKVSPKLTLNLGLRWEREGPATDRHNAITNFDPYNAATVRGVPLVGTLQYPGYNGLDRGDRNASWFDFMPRVGFAYQVNSKTVVRSGFGLYYLPSTGIFVTLGRTGYDATTPLTATNASVQGGFYPVANLSDPFPSGLIAPLGGNADLSAGVGTSVSATMRSLKRGYSQQFHMSVQRTLPAQIILEVGYSGNRGVSLPALRSLTYLPASVRSSYTVAQLQAAVPNPYCIITQPGIVCNATVQQSQLLSTYPQFSGVNVLDSWASSTYHALTIRAERRFGNGLAFTASYTFSKLLDNNLGNGGNSYQNRGSNGVQNPENLSLERAISAIDLPQRFVTSVLYDLPFDRTGSPLVKGLFGKWQINGIFATQSGEPIGVTTSVGNSPFGGSRPNLIGAPRPQNPTIDHWLDPAAFTVAAPLMYGSAPRNLSNYRSDGLQNLDISVLKTIPLRERLTMQFRAEASNVTNTPTFGLPASGFGAANFGIVTSTVSAPRNIQLGLKLMF